MHQGPPKILIKVMNKDSNNTEANSLPQQPFQKHSSI